MKKDEADFNRIVTTLMIAIVALVLFIVSAYLPWWGMRHENSGHITTVDITSISVMQGNDLSVYQDARYVQILLLATTLILTGAMICISIFIFSLLIVRIIKPRDSKFPKIIGIIGLVLCFLAPMIFMALPYAMKADAEAETLDDATEFRITDHDDPTKSFFGTYSFEEEYYHHYFRETQTWGGDIGWLLTILSSGIFTVVVITTIREPKKLRSPKQADQPFQTYPNQAPKEQQPHSPAPRPSRFDLNDRYQLR